MFPGSPVGQCAAEEGTSALDPLASSSAGHASAAERARQREIARYEDYALH
jgi:hypothetical protein